MLIIYSDSNCQRFKIQSHGDVRRKEVFKSGLWLVAEQWVESDLIAIALSAGEMLS
jgi:hypothetical protein